MDKSLHKDFIKAKSDHYKQMLLRQDRNNIHAYEYRLDKAYSEWKDIVSSDIYEKIINISDQLLHAVIGYTFDCFADMLAEHDVDGESKDAD